MSSTSPLSDYDLSLQSDCDRAYEDALAAHEAGDHARALAILEPLAARDNVRTTPMARRMLGAVGLMP